jgi:hypothetical protein
MNMSHRIETAKPAAPTHSSAERRCTSSSQAVSGTHVSSASSANG